MNPSFNMPTGWRFCPEDTELIKDYLYNKIKAQKLPFEGVIVEYDLYGIENPWEIWERFSEYVVKSFHYEDLYVFTKLKRKNYEAKHVERKVGLGSWEGEGHAKKIIINNFNNMNRCVIGFMKRFRFEKSGTNQDGKWILHEYSLHPSLFPSNYCPHMQDYVVCRIRKNDRTVKLQNKRKEPEENQQKYYEEQKDNQRNKNIRIEEPKENIQKRIPPAKIEEEKEEETMNDFCSWLETHLSSDEDQGEKNEGNLNEDEENLDLPISNMLDNVELFYEEETESSKHNFFSWSNKFLSSDAVQGEKNEGNLNDDEEYLDLPISNMLENEELFFEEETESSMNNFSSWAQKFFRLGEGESTEQ